MQHLLRKVQDMLVARRCWIAVYLARNFKRLLTHLSGFPSSAPFGFPLAPHPIPLAGVEPQSVAPCSQTADIWDGFRPASASSTRHA
jgi:hypothetical protein